MSFGAVGALSVLLLLLLFVAACSGDGGDADHTDPTATEPIAVDPTATDPVAEDPTATESAAEDPTATESAAEDPTATESAAEDPTATESAAEDPTATEPAPEDPTATEPSGTRIDVSLVEFIIEPSIGTAQAGTITFNVSSEGIIFHNFKVVATGLSPDALPFDEALFVVIEEQLNIVASTADLDPGQQETLTVELAPGSYVLFCNIPTHYQVGMTVGFTVE